MPVCMLFRALSRGGSVSPTLAQQHLATRSNSSQLLLATCALPAGSHPSRCGQPASHLQQVLPLL